MAAGRRPGGWRMAVKKTASAMPRTSAGHGRGDEAGGQQRTARAAPSSLARPNANGSPRPTDDDRGDERQPQAVGERAW